MWASSASKPDDAQHVLEQHLEEEHGGDAAEQQAHEVGVPVFVAEADSVLVGDEVGSVDLQNSSLYRWADCLAEHGPVMTKVLLMVLLGATLTGCIVPIIESVDATVVGENPEGIWFREPSIGSGNMQQKAVKHCAKYGKQAVYQATMLQNNPYVVPIVAYNCE